MPAPTQKRTVFATLPAPFDALQLTQAHASYLTRGTIRVARRCVERGARGLDEMAAAWRSRVDLSTLHKGIAPTLFDHRRKGADRLLSVCTRVLGRRLTLGQIGVSPIERGYTKTTYQLATDFVIGAEGAFRRSRVTDTRAFGFVTTWGALALAWTEAATGEALPASFVERVSVGLTRTDALIEAGAFA